MDIQDIVNKEKAINRFARITQFLTWPFIFIIFKLFFSIKISGRENFGKVKSPFIIIANHLSFYDSFIFRLALGFNTPHLPLRFMAVNKFDWKFLNFLAFLGIIDLVYSLFGVFTIVPGQGKGTWEAREIIKSGGNIVIYPEGKIVHADGIGQFKKGAAVISQQMNVEVIPVAFHLDKSSFIVRKLTINIGEAIQPNTNLTIEEQTTLFRKKLIELYKS